MTDWPARNQQGPAFWDDQLRAYVNETPAREASTPGSDFADLLNARDASLGAQVLTEAGEQTDEKIALAFTRAPKPIDLLHARLAKTGTGPTRGIMLGSSTPAGTGASEVGRRMTNMLALLIQRAYPSGVTLWEPPTILGTDITYAANLPGFQMANAAIGGTTSANYVPGSAITQITTWQPHVVFHMIGANDYRLEAPNPGQTEVNITTAMLAIDAVLTTPAVHVVCGTYASPDQVSPDYPWSDYLAAMQAAAEAHPRGVFVDASYPFVQAGASGPGATDPLDLIGVDLVHATDAGHALLAREIVRQLALPDVLTSRLFLPSAYDRFNRLTLGSTECGQAWAEQSTAVHVPNGTYLTVTTLGNAVVNTGFSDAEVSAVCTLSAGAVSGLIAKSNDNLTRIGWYYNGPNDRMELYRGTTLLDFSSALGLVAGREYHLRLVAKGDSALGYLDGSLLRSASIDLAGNPGYASFTQHGVRANSTTGAPKWRNFSVNPAA